MKFLHLFVLQLFCLILSCGQIAQKTDKMEVIPTSPHQIYSDTGQLLQTRFIPPEGFERILVTENSFGQYLRHLPLKPDGAKVLYYNGQQKPNRGVYAAVVDLPIGKRDLHQCADAVMRLRADYFYAMEEYDAIHFNFTNGFRADYAKWRAGQRIKINNNRSSWYQKTTPNGDYTTYWKYLEIVFAYAGTYSLNQELHSVDLEAMQIGDVFIQGGFPGHAIIVVDMAIEAATGKKVFLLAQSYMPAQELQILQNPNDSSISPWYKLDFGTVLNTPEWDFEASDLKRF